MIYPSKSDQPFAKDTNNTTPYNFVLAQPLVLLNIKIIHMDISLSSIIQSRWLLRIPGERITKLRNLIVEGNYV